MKLLKLVLITAIFLQSAGIAYPAPNETANSSVNFERDTLRYKRRHSLALPQPLHLARNAKELSYNDCMFVKRYSIDERLKQYPFSKAAKIMIVSFACCYPDELINLNDDTVKKISQPVKFTDSIFPAGLNIRNGELNYSSLKEVKYLNQHQINSLTNILYNTTRKRKNNVATPGGACFNPRNAFVFLDKNGKVFDYLQVCFECDRMRSLSYRIWFKTGCNQSLDYLKKFLIDAGMKYGTIEK